jgi:hypothetical protein
MVDSEMEKSIEYTKLLFRKKTSEHNDVVDLFINGTKEYKGICNQYK